jgi:hypothetical protein
MKHFSTTTLISFGLACLTLTLALAAQSLGLAPDGAQALLSARVQFAELVAAQCSPAAATGDQQAMIDILQRVALHDKHLTSAGLRDSRESSSMSLVNMPRSGQSRNHAHRWR